MTAAVPYRPPAPNPRSPVRSLLRVVLRGERNLLSLFPDLAYRRLVSRIGLTRRGILLVNDPALVQRILADPDGIFPKSDLMVGALEELVGDSLFVSSGATWRRQRRMVDPAFSHMRIHRAFLGMDAAVDTYCAHLDALADGGTPFSLDAAMSHLTADIICRTIFSTSLESQVAREVFDDFTVFERHVAHVDVARLLFSRPWAHIPQPADVAAACRRIRGHVGALLDPRLAAGAAPQDDIAGALLEARDADTGAPFTREELIDQVGVFFLAGHETTASALTWAFFILSQRPDVVARVRAEVAQVVGDGPVTFEHTRRLPFIRNVFRETMRLYPPITFLPRVALRPTTIGGFRVRRGSMVMIAPWAMHRHERLWRDPDRFDPDRFLPEREGEVPAGAYLPFGLGPRVCVGAAFATVEGALILARLVRRYDWEALVPGAVRPAARLTTRPEREVTCRVRRAG